MAQVIFDPEEKGTAAGMEHDSVISRGDSQPEARMMAHNLRPDGPASASQIRAANGDLDRFRHLFGPKRRGR